MDDNARTINILGVVFTVKEVDCVNKTDPRKGEIDYLTNEIRIDRNMPPSSKNQTLMHEILHGMFDLLGLEELRDDETKVQVMATALHQIFRAQDVFKAV